MKAITVQTKLVGILGNPVKHSLSPLMQNAAFQALDLDYYYLPVEVTAENLGAVVGGIRHMNFAGFNVTMPHKVNIIPCLDEIDSLAEMIGSVNTVVIENGRLKGYTTDGIGFVRSLEQEKGVSVQDKKIIILGAGGAANSIALTLASCQAREIVISNRTAQKASQLSDRINQRLRRCSRAMSADQELLRKELQDTDILINTTSVGMPPEVKNLPIDPGILHPGLLVCEIIYHPLHTRFLAAAENAGCATLNGLGMLIYQGAESFKLWTGRTAPVEIMKNLILAAVNLP